jgi:cell division protein FtsI (penicillin-binding protein 3)
MMSGARRLLGRKSKSASGSSQTDWRVLFAVRMRLAAVFCVLWLAAIVGRLVQLQVVKRAEMVSRAERQQNRTVKAYAKRGDIVDRNGRVLAMSADADSVYAVPAEVARDEREAWSAATVTRICGALRDCTSAERKTLVERLGRPSPFAFVRRLVDPAQASRISALNLKGVGFLKESRRFYPNSELAAHVLGYLGTEHRGLGGIEAAYDKLIAGADGVLLVQSDATGKVFSRTEKPPTAGASIELTIDTYLQHMVERELHAGVVANRAAGGTAIIMNPRTGEILAMANEPTFDPNEYRESTDVERRNRAVQDLYEPGSTFKVVTASAAIQEHVMPVDEPIDVSGGRIAIGSRVVHDDHHYGVLSFTDVIVKSSNVGAIKIGFRVGTDRLSEYVKRFGFGKPTSPDFPGESPGIVWDPAKWTDSALASVSMGYQVGVTPLQMVTAVSAVANGGELMEPRIIGAVYRDQLRYPVHQKVVRRVIDQNTAATLTTIMEGVVEKGTAKAAQIPGYTIAGKTGTAAKLVDGRYSKQEYNASFVGFVPSRNPVFAIIVVTDSPRAGTYYGGSVSAPIFKRIAEAALRHQGVPTSIDPPPAVLVSRPGSSPADRRDIPQFQSTVVQNPAPADVVPDVTGMSAREATRMLAQFGMAVRLAGDGFVVAQTPAAGSPILPGGECRLVLGRLQARRDQGGAATP